MFSILKIYAKIKGIGFFVAVCVCVCVCMCVDGCLLAHLSQRLICAFLIEIFLLFVIVIIIVNYSH